MKSLRRKVKKVDGDPKKVGCVRVYETCAENGTLESTRTERLLTWDDKNCIITYELVSLVAGGKDVVGSMMRYGVETVLLFPGKDGGTMIQKHGMLQMEKYVLSASRKGLEIEQTHEAKCFGRFDFLKT